MTSTFLVPAPESMPSARVDLTFGLRSAMRFHREQAVPGIAGVWFVRQLSWTAAALRLLRSAGSAIRVANAIEALACKCTWEVDPETYRFRGKRAFTRDQAAGIWGFKDLCKPAHYVQITYRQSTVRALPEGAGLGFAIGSAVRFNGMQLSGVGTQLADALLEQRGIGRGSRSVRSYLEDWMEGRVVPGERGSPSSIHAVLGPDRPAAAEREIVRGRLRSRVAGGICAEDPDRRRRLADFFQSSAARDWESLLAFLEADPSGSGRRHSGHLQNACAFEDMVAACVSVLERCASATPEAGIPLRLLAERVEVREGMEEVYETARAYRERSRNKLLSPFPDDALAFADEMLRSPVDVMESLVRRDGRILRVLDSQVTQGALYRTGFSGNTVADPEDGADQGEDEEPGGDGESQEPETREAPKWPLWRLRQWEALWADCEPRRDTP